MKPIDPETRRFYALPGMTRANRRKQKLIFRWTLAVALTLGGLICGLIYLLNR
jgi:FAD/FMN-containing dehydrogenase